MAGRRWEESEIEFIKTHFDKMSCAEMAQSLPGRTTKAVQHMYGQLGLERPQPKPGDVFERLTILEIFMEEKYGQQISMAKVRCGCEKQTEKVVKLTSIVSGHTVSCGCLRNEKARARTIERNKIDGASHPKHGMSTSRLYKTYHAMMKRCYLKTATGYDHYGGRGISVCEAWRSGFEVFAAWANENGYQDNLSIERKDVNGDYCPENCKFATYKEQSNNTRSNHLLTAFGETKTLAQWYEDERCVVDYQTLRCRIAYYGWQPEESLVTPSMRKNK